MGDGPGSAASESLPALRLIVMGAAACRLGSPVSLDLSAIADSTPVPRFCARRPEPRARGGVESVHANLIGAGLVVDAGSCTASVSSLSRLSGSAGFRGECVFRRHARGRTRAIHP